MPHISTPMLPCSLHRLATRHPRPCKLLRRSRIQCGTRASYTTERLRYIEEVAVVQQPKNLHRLTTVLSAQGHVGVSPADRNGLHPLLIPLTCGPASNLTGHSPLPHTAQTAGIDAGALPADGDVLVCLLRWHNPREHQSMPMPVVSMARNARSMALLARSVDEYVNRTLAEEDHAAGEGGAPGPVTEALGGSVEEGVYAPGDVRAAQLPSLAAYVTRKVGLFPDTVEQLVRDHMQRGDTMSALLWRWCGGIVAVYTRNGTGAMITGEWYMRHQHFSGWGRPFEFNSLLFSNAGRHEEARDTARIALRMPWWTLSLGFATVRDMAQLQGDAAAITEALNETANNQPNQQFVQRKEPELVALDNAALLLNQAAAGEAEWDAIRAPLAAQYVEAGFREVADFVLT